MSRQPKNDNVIPIDIPTKPSADLATIEQKTEEKPAAAATNNIAVNVQVTLPASKWAPENIGRDKWWRIAGRNIASNSYVNGAGQSIAGGARNVWNSELITWARNSRPGNALHGLSQYTVNYMRQRSAQFWISAGVHIIALNLLAAVHRHTTISEIAGYSNNESNFWKFNLFATYALSAALIAWDLLQASKDITAPYNAWLDAMTRGRVSPDQAQALEPGRPGAETRTGIVRLADFNGAESTFSAQFKGLADGLMFLAAAVAIPVAAMAKPVLKVDKIAGFNSSYSIPVMLGGAAFLHMITTTFLGHNMAMDKYSQISGRNPKLSPVVPPDTTAQRRIFVGGAIVTVIGAAMTAFLNDPDKQVNGSIAGIWVATAGLLTITASLNVKHHNYELYATAQRIKGLLTISGNPSEHVDDSGQALNKPAGKRVPYNIDSFGQIALMLLFSAGVAAGITASASRAQVNASLVLGLGMATAIAARILTGKRGQDWTNRAVNLNSTFTQATALSAAVDEARRQQAAMTEGAQSQATAVATATPSPV